MINLPLLWVALFKAFCHCCDVYWKMMSSNHSSWHRLIHVIFGSFLNYSCSVEQSWSSSALVPCLSGLVCCLWILVHVWRTPWSLRVKASEKNEIPHSHLVARSHRYHLLVASPRFGVRLPVAESEMTTVFQPSAWFMRQPWYCHCPTAKEWERQSWNGGWGALNAFAAAATASHP